MPKAQTLRVKAGRHFELNRETGLAVGAMAHAIRPRSVQALKTLLFMDDCKPARLQDVKAFERVKSLKDLVELAPDKAGKIAGISSGAVLGIVRAIPLGPKVPPVVQWQQLRARRCSCHATAQKGDGYAMAQQPRTRSIVVPEWIQQFRLYASMLLFQDIVVESGAVLTIACSHLAARHFVLRPGGRVVQKCDLTLDLSGSFRNNMPD